jgi:hypothetical protein
MSDVETIQPDDGSPKEKIEAPTDNVEAPKD